LRKDKIIQKLIIGLRNFSGFIVGGKFSDLLKHENFNPNPI
jgi:hypothetical protein